MTKLLCMLFGHKSVRLEPLLLPAFTTATGFGFGRAVIDRFYCVRCGTYYLRRRQGAGLGVRVSRSGGADGGI